MSTKNTYTWKISDTEMIQQIRTCKGDKHFVSDIFKLHNISWDLRFYPNGTGKDNGGGVTLRLCSVKYPSNVKRANYRQNIIFVEGNKSHTRIVPSAWTGEAYGGDQFFDTKALLNYDCLTFKVSIDIIDLLNGEGQSVNIEKDEKEHKNNKNNTDSTNLLNLKVNTLETRINE
eukprot:344492_1